MTINGEGSETIFPGPDSGRIESTMKGKVAKENDTTGRKIGKEKSPGQLIREGH